MTSFPSDPPKPVLKFKPVQGEWYDIPGYVGKYQICTTGEVRRIYQTKPPFIMHVFTKKSAKNYVFINLMNQEGKMCMHTVSSLMMQTFYGVKPGFWRFVHKDGLYSNNDLDNLEFLSLHEIGKLYGGRAGRIPVAKISEDGEIMEVYPSARKAGKNNPFSYMAIMDRCNKKIKKEFFSTGYTFRWYADVAEVERFCRMLKRKYDMEHPAKRPYPTEWEW